MNLKICSVCKIKKQRTDFHKKSAASDGLKSSCKECRALYAANYYQKNKLRLLNYSNTYKKLNKDKVALYFHNWQKNNPDKVANNGHAYRVRKINNGSFKVTKKFLRKLYSSPCIGCGSKENISMDHIVPISRGGKHSEGNLQPLCHSCNSSKNNKFMIEWQIWRRIERSWGEYWT